MEKVARHKLNDEIKWVCVHSLYDLGEGLSNEEFPSENSRIADNLDQLDLDFLMIPNL